jgi:hypothetical protein
MAMADLLFIALMVVFFGLAVLLIKACDRIIGADEEVVVRAADDDVEPQELAA